MATDWIAVAVAGMEALEVDSVADIRAAGLYYSHSGRTLSVGSGSL